MTAAARVADHLGHILRAIERIGRYTADMDQAAFLGNELVQDAVLRNMAVSRPKCNTGFSEPNLTGISRTRPRWT